MKPSFSSFSDIYLDSNGAKILDKRIIKGTIQYEVLWRSNGKRSTTWVPISYLSDTKLAHLYEKKARKEREELRQSWKSAHVKSVLPIIKLERDNVNPAKNCDFTVPPSEDSVNDEMDVEVNGEVNSIESTISTSQSSEHSVRKTRVSRTTRGRSSKAITDDLYLYDYDDIDIFKEEVESPPKAATNEEKGPQETPKSTKLSGHKNGKQVNRKNTENDDDDDDLFLITKKPIVKKKARSNGMDYINFYASQKVANSCTTPPRKLSDHRRLSIPSVRSFATSPSPFISTALDSRCSNEIESLKRSGMVPLEITENKNVCVVKFDHITRLIPKAVLLEHFPDEYEDLITNKNASNKPIQIINIDMPLNSPQSQSNESFASSPVRIDDCAVPTTPSESTNIIDDEEFEVVLSPRSSSMRETEQLFAL